MTLRSYAQGLEGLSFILYNFEMFGKVHFTKFDFGRECRFI